MHCLRLRARAATIVILTVGALLGAVTALSDTVGADADAIVAGNQTTVNLGTVYAGQVISRTVAFRLVCAGNKHVDNGQSVTVARQGATLDGVAVGTSVVGATNATVGPIPASWPDDNNGCGAPTPSAITGGTSTVTITVPNSPGAHTIVLTYGSAPTPAGSDDPASVTGNTQVTYTLDIQQDTTPPSLVSCESPDGAWHAANVTLLCTYSDAQSGPATQTVSLVTSVGAGSEDANAAASAGGAQACDAVGNCAPSPASIAGNEIDRKAPVASTCQSPDGTWHGSNVTLTCAYTDGGAGPASQTVSLVTSVAAGTENPSASASAGGAQACDSVGNCAVSPPDIPGNKIDRKAPALVSCESPDGAWHGADVTLSCTYSDTGAGPATITLPLATSVAAGSESANAAASAGGMQACDSVGNCAASPADIVGNKIDREAPAVDSCDASDALWHAANVSLQCTYSDGGSGPASQTLSLSTTIAAGDEAADAPATAGGAQACDSVGNCAASPADLVGNKIDRKAPEGTCDAPDGAWHASNVTLPCTYTDGGSGPATQDIDLTSAVPAGDEDADATASAGGAQACDAVGNCAASPADIAGNKVDRKAPTLDSCESPDGAWHGSNVTLGCDYSDGGSGPAMQSVDLTTAVAAGDEDANATASAGGDQACDPVGNCAVAPADVTGNKVDRKAPTVTEVGARSAPNASGWYRVAVVDEFTANDGGSGLAPSCAASFARSSGPAEGATVGVPSGSCADAVGNDNPGVEGGPFRIDLTAPTVAIAGVTEGSHYVLGSVPVITCTTTDALSGVATNAGPSVTGPEPGQRTATCAGAADVAGNPATSWLVTFQVRLAPTGTGSGNGAGDGEGSENGNGGPPPGRPQAPASGSVAKPAVRARTRLAISVAGPRTVRAGAPFLVRVRVRNTGSTTANDTLLALGVEKGLVVAGAKRAYARAAAGRPRWRLGRLPAGHETAVTLRLQAAPTARGTILARAVASASNAADVRARYQVRVLPAVREVAPLVAG